MFKPTLNFTTGVLDALREFIYYHSGIHISLNIENICKIVYCSLLSRERYVKKILDKTSPRKVFLVCYYGGLTTSFILECKKRGIKTYDIHHGFVTKKAI